ncbi:MAG: glucosamine-6-phosphate deaminase [Deltaproteobacteria bacterium]|nr:glucosamine-6-phosphate deaminase [Deltaproteobacteria bacterium]
MNFLVLPDAAHVARYVSSLVVSTIRGCPTAAVALPTGKTPLPIYAALAPRLATREVEASRASWFALDEFLGKEVPVEATFRHFLLSRFIAPAELSPDRLVTLCTACDDPAAEAARYEEAIRCAGGLQLALLGLGGNGHVAFNEPGSPRDGRTGLRPLTELTRQANEYLFSSAPQVPTHGLSMGIGTLLEARRLVVAATGTGKANIVARLAASDPDEALPASLLKLHPDCTVVLDEAAAGGIGR